MAPTPFAKRTLRARCLHLFRIALLLLLIVAPGFLPDYDPDSRLSRVAVPVATTSRSDLWRTAGISQVAAETIAQSLEATQKEIETTLGISLNNRIRVILASPAEYYRVLRVALHEDPATLRKIAKRTGGVASSSLPWVVVVCQPICSNDQALRHELTHALMYASLGNWRARMVPAWFNEGVAVLLENPAPEPDKARLAALRIQALGQQAALPNLSSLHDQGRWNNSLISERYDLARHAVELYLQDVAPHSLSEIIAALSGGSTLQELTLRWRRSTLAAFEAGLGDRLSEVAASGPRLEVYPTRSGSANDPRSRVIISGLTPGESFRIVRYHPHTSSSSWETADATGIFEEIRSTSAADPWGLRILRKSGEERVAASPPHDKARAVIRWSD